MFTEKSDKNKTYLLLGSNLGDRFQYLQKARDIIASKIGKIEQASNIYETEAWGLEDQPAHLNQILLVNTVLKPLELLHQTQNIEKSLGRTKRFKWDNRIIDIDIIFYNNEIVKFENLKIPHPYLQERNFVLIPLSEIAGNYMHPVFQKKVSELLKESKDKLKAVKI
ncbi:MAG TPA: 2-amino-4-hydroxy-6-hydroxymethyldihydropteridine diphosphokinase [Edaphocola sp.]|nr:2-amino-4-hydroxy-6-hydroxymethyldihydropteridine diphosphokinase [Edaphocola sp.]